MPVGQQAPADMAAGQPKTLLRASSTLACRTKEEERRIICAALAHWESCRPTRDDLPDAEAIDLYHPLLRPHFYIVRIHDIIGDSLVEHCGGALTAICGRPVVGQRLSGSLPRGIAADRLDYLDAAARLGKPMAESSTFQRDDGQVILFRDAIMPLASHNGCRLLLGAISFRLGTENDL